MNDGCYDLPAGDFSVEDIKKAVNRYVTPADVIRLAGLILDEELNVSIDKIRIQKSPTFPEGRVLLLAVMMVIGMKNCTIEVTTS